MGFLFLSDVLLGLQLQQQKLTGVTRTVGSVVVFKTVEWSFVGPVHVGIFLFLDISACHVPICSNAAPRDLRPITVTVGWGDV